MSTETTTAPYTETRWPWHMKVTRTDGTVREDDYSDGFGGRPILEYAQFLSGVAGVERVELTTAFVAGEQVAPVTEVTAR
jgi:hypothetical protein